MCAALLCCLVSGVSKLTGVFYIMMVLEWIAVHKSEHVTPAIPGGSVKTLVNACGLLDRLTEAFQGATAGQQNEALI